MVRYAAHRRYAGRLTEDRPMMHTPPAAAPAGGRFADVDLGVTPIADRISHYRRKMASDLASMVAEDATLSGLTVAGLIATLSR